MPFLLFGRYEKKLFDVVRMNYDTFGSLLVDALFKQRCINILGIHRFGILPVEVVLDAIGFQGRIFLYQMVNQEGAVGPHKTSLDLGPHGALAHFVVAGIQQFSLGLTFFDIVINKGAVDP